MSGSLLRPSNFLAASCLVLASQLQAVTNVAMPAPSAPASAPEVLEAAHRGRGTGLFVAEDFELGPYRISQVQRSAVSSSGFSFGSRSRETQKSQFAFQFSGSSQPWQGRCEFKSLERALELGRSTRLSNTQSRLHCACQDAAQRATMELDDEWLPMEGRMQVGSSSYTVTQILAPRSEGGLTAPAIGYRLLAESGGSPAGVDVLYSGRMWRQPELPLEQAEPVACLLAALMLYGPQQ